MSNIINIEERMFLHNEAAQRDLNYTPRWTVRINNPKGWTENSCSSYKEAVSNVVDLCMRNGEKPRLHWWQFNRSVWPADCVTEYKKTTLNPL